MDLLKTMLEKFSGFVAPLIPGAAVLMLFGIHYPDWATTIRDIAYLGYRTKLSLVLAAAFISGWTVITVFGAMVGFLEGTSSVYLEKWLQGGEEQKAPPWRNSIWRALVTVYLGSAAPEDLDFVSDEVLAIQIQTANLLPDPLERAKEAARFTNIKGKAAIVDYDWKSWWRTLHHHVLQAADPVTQLSLTIESNLQAASLVLLCAIPWTPVLSHWWVISPCVFWLVMRVLRTFAYLRQVREPWSSFAKQMDYLRSQMPSVKAKEQASSDSN